MNDLPDPDPQGVKPPPSVGSLAKEKEAIGVGSAELPIRDVGSVEMELPREVASAGVKVTPTSVTLPLSVQQAGVQSTGPNVPVGTGKTVTLPLTDDQIAQGLHQSVKSSWRWLAEWCIRRLKQLHLTLQSDHGHTA